MKRFLSLILVIYISIGLLCPATAYAEPSDAPDIKAESAILVDAKSGRILYEKNAYETAFPASVTKILTCLLALEQTTMDETITVSPQAIAATPSDASNMGLVAGEKLSASTCLYGVMVASANEAAYAMAEHISGSAEKFADLMNERAAALGCKNSHFVNANGLHNDDHYTCAYDVALILREALNYPFFKTLSSTLSFDVPASNKHTEDRRIWNTLEMLYPARKTYYEHVEGGKTGHTQAAGYALASFGSQGDMEIICVVFHCPERNDSFSDTKALYEYAFSQFHSVYPFQEADKRQEDASNNVLLTNFYQSSVKALDKLTYDTDYSVMVDKDVSFEELDTRLAVTSGDTPELTGDLVISHAGQVLGTTPFVLEPPKLHIATKEELEAMEKEQRMRRILTYTAVTVGTLLTIIVFFTLLSRFSIYLHRKRNRKRRAKAKKHKSRK